MKKVLLSLVMILSLLTITGCNSQSQPKNNITKPTEKSQNKESDNMTKINVIINNENYILNLENNDTTKEFIKLLPKEYTMNELNGNEKYVQIATSLPTDSYNPKQINQGDVMLFGDNCIVIFYKTFTTPYSYTKIGHIDNLPDLGNDKITAKFEI